MPALNLEIKHVKAVHAMWGGVLFSLVFTTLIWFLGREFLYPIDLLPDRPGFWYAWQLREPNFWTHATAWGGYALHQITIWWLIYRAQSQGLRYSENLHSVNRIALGANAIFISLHLIQTHIWYDGLAQDVPEASSQWSVILLLVSILLIENQRRGLVLGKKAPFLKESARVLRKYHGYYFSWAIIYTFWFHPMEFTSGHLIGFAYMFLLMLQGSLFFTRIHLNKWWTLVQEITVLAHGTMVAVMNRDGLWPMFFFGFAAIFVVTQMYGLGLKRWQRWIIWFIFSSGTLIVYSSRGWNKIDEVLRIPLTEYLVVFAIAGLIWMGIRVAKLTRKLISRTSDSIRST